MDKLKEHNYLLALLLIFSGVMTTVVLGRILFDTGAPYAPDPGAFFRITSNLADAITGHQSWKAVLSTTGERTVIMMVPPALLGVLSGYRTPEFYMAVAWFIYVLPLPFLYLSLVKSFRKLSILDFAIAALFISTTPILNLGTLYFTDVPGLTMAIAGLACLSHGIKQSSKWNMALGFFLLAMGVLVRLPNAVPFFMAMLLVLWLRHREIKYSYKLVIQSIVIAIIATILTGVAFRFDLPIVYAYKLNASWDQTIWKYGNGNLEFGVQNILLFRLKKFAESTIWMLLPFVLLLALSFPLGRTTSSHSSKSLHLKYAFATLLSVVLYCVIASKIMFYNGRYIIPVLAIMIPYLAWVSFSNRTAKIIAALSIVFSLDTMLFHVGTVGIKTPISSTLKKLNPGWMAPIGLTAKRNIHSPVGEISNALLAAGADSHPVYVEFLTLQSPLLMDVYFKFYLKYMGPTDSMWSLADKNIHIDGQHNGEMRVSEIYNRYALNNARAYVNADFIVLSRNNSLVPDYVKNWPEYGLHNDLNEKSKGSGQSFFGLQQISEAKAWIKGPFDDTNTKYVLYKVVDRDLFVRQVKEHFCQLKGINDPLFHYWCKRDTSSETIMEIPVDKNTMASSVSVLQNGTNPIIKVMLKWKPEEGFSRVFAHFIPAKKSSDCQFFTVDHPIWQKDETADFAVFPSKKIRNIKTCDYIAKIGVMSIKDNKNIFSEKEFEQSIK